MTRKFLKTSEDFISFILKILPFIIGIITAFSSATSFTDLLGYVAEFYSLGSDILGASAFITLVSYFGFSATSNIVIYGIYPLLYCCFIDVVRLLIDFCFVFIKWCCAKFSKLLGGVSDDK